MSIVVKDGAGALQTVATNDDVIAMVATAEGQAAAQASAEALAGAVDEAAPASDTAPSGQNGRLQRLAQHLASLLARLPAALTGSGNLKVALVESLATLQVHLASVATATTASVASSTFNQTIVAANAARQGLSIYNDDASALLIKYGATASATSYKVRIPGGAYWERPDGDRYTGIIDGIWEAAGSGGARVTEQ